MPAPLPSLIPACAISPCGGLAGMSLLRAPVTSVDVDQGLARSDWPHDRQHLCIAQTNFREHVLFPFMPPTACAFSHALHGFP